MGNLATLDIIIFLVYFVVVAGYGIWIYKKKKSAASGSKDYFLAEGSLTGGQSSQFNCFQYFCGTVHRNVR
jgi:Na+/proline symporter